MNCYLCDDATRETPAVATCRHCGVGLCREHLDRDLLATRPHGMSRRACTHDPVAGAQRGRRTSAVRIPSPV
jgi:Uncharacterized protein conserved in archaea (DUF2180)